MHTVKHYGMPYPKTGIDMISLTNATVEYQEKALALPNINLYKGERLGLNGVSGSGKSTLAMVLAGFIKPKMGELNVPVYGKKAPNPVQWVGQHPELAFNPKWHILKSLKESFQEHDFEHLLCQFDIDKQWLSRFPIELSGGQLQRLALLRALTPSTQYLLCDEITAQLDSITQQSIWKQLLILQEKRNIGLLVISHEKHLLNSICKKIVTIN
ncbi:ATP-binding cassette domain-containing protein [Aliivibrio fischeri]|nr:ATP-binding cassette domain-containing protein [Aliivibrio fischeri]